MTKEEMAAVRKVKREISRLGRLCELAANALEKAL
jgi:hypothetical protein